jgi:hypothetical protein
MYDIHKHVERERNILVRTPPFDKLPKTECWELKSLNPNLW